MTENKRDINPEIYAHVKTMKLINDVRPVGESNDDASANACLCCSVTVLSSDVDEFSARTGSAVVVLFDAI